MRVKSTLRFIKVSFFQYRIACKKCMTEPTCYYIETMYFFSTSIFYQKIIIIVIICSLIANNNIIWRNTGNREIFAAQKNGIRSA